MNPKHKLIKVTRRLSQKTTIPRSLKGPQLKYQTFERKGLPYLVEGTGSGYECTLEWSCSRRLTRFRSTTILSGAMAII